MPEREIARADRGVEGAIVGSAHYDPRMTDVQDPDDSKDPEELRLRLAADSDQLLRTLEEIRELEERHRQEPISSPAFDALAAAIEKRAAEVVRNTLIQQVVGDAIPTGDISIEDIAGTKGPPSP
jgi:hypothetical protein